MEAIASLLEVELREGEFESNNEYQRTCEVLEECRQALASHQTQEVVWHPYPEVPLPETEFAKAYLVTAVSSKGDQELFVRSAYGGKNFLAYENEFTVVAWTEMPDPYTPKND